MNTLKSFYTKHPLISGLTSAILITSVGARVAHQLPLNGLSDEGYLAYQIEHKFNTPELLRDYLNLNPYDTEIIIFSEDTVFIRDNTHKRLYSLTCPSNEQDKDREYCLLRDNPVTIDLGKIVFGSGVPIPNSVKGKPFDVLNKRYPIKQGSFSDI